MLGHVRDLGLATSDPNVRIYQTTERQHFHTDSCDIVGLLCLKTAKSGGLSSLTSSMAIYNEMAKRRPDLVARLFQPIPTDRRGEVPAGKKPCFEIPIYNDHAGYLSVLYSRPYIHSGQRFPEAPPPEPEDIEALDLFDELAERCRSAARHAAPARRHAVRAQPHDPARPHRVRGLARAGEASAICCGCGWPPPAPARCRRSMPSATAASRSATAAASSARAPGCTRRWSRCKRHHGLRTFGRGSQGYLPSPFTSARAAGRLPRGAVSPCRRGARTAWRVAGRS